MFLAHGSICMFPYERCYFLCCCWLILPSIHLCCVRFTSGLNHNVESSCIGEYNPNDESLICTIFICCVSTIVCAIPSIITLSSKTKPRLFYKKDNTKRLCEPGGTGAKTIFTAVNEKNTLALAWASHHGVVTLLPRNGSLVWLYWCLCYLSHSDWQGWTISWMNPTW